MSSSMTPIDISNMPDLLDLVAEVETTKKPRELKRDDKVVAVLSPAVQKEQDASEHTKADYQKSLAAIGSWSDLNPDELIAKIYRWREEGSRQANRP
jgi:hypothetical protein